MTIVDENAGRFVVLEIPFATLLEDTQLTFDPSSPRVVNNRNAEVRSYFSSDGAGSGLVVFPLGGGVRTGDVLPFRVYFGVIEEPPVGAPSYWRDEMVEGPVSNGGIVLEDFDPGGQITWFGTSGAELHNLNHVTRAFGTGVDHSTLHDSRGALGSTEVVTLTRVRFNEDRLTVVESIGEFGSARLRELVLVGELDAALIVTRFEERGGEIDPLQVYFAVDIDIEPDTSDDQALVSGRICATIDQASDAPQGVLFADVDGDLVTAGTLDDIDTKVTERSLDSTSSASGDVACAYRVAPLEVDGAVTLRHAVGLVQDPDNVRTLSRRILDDLPRVVVGNRVDRP